MQGKNFKELVNRIEIVDGIIKKLDPSIREQAFSLFIPYLKSGKSIESRESEPPSGADSDDESAEQFFTKYDHDKPAENAVMLASYFYSMYGTEAFSLDDMRNLSNDVGVTIPARIDMTY